MVSEGSRAYLAGIIDGEGSIIFREGKHMTPDVSVTNTDERLMLWLVEMVGGSVSRQRHAGQESIDGTVHRKDVFKWHVIGYRAVVVLRAIRPWLLLKGTRADDVIARYEAHLALMKRPKRREHHIERERAAMVEKGWYSPE